MITPKILFRVQKGNLETFEYLTTIKEPGVFQGAHVYKSVAYPPCARALALSVGVRAHGRVCFVRRIFIYLF